MGYVEIPPNPSGEGRLKVTMQLDMAELQHTVMLLKQAAQRMHQQRGGALSGAQSGPPRSAISQTAAAVPPRTDAQWTAPQPQLQQQQQPQYQQPQIAPPAAARLPPPAAVQPSYPAARAPAPAPITRPAPAPVVQRPPQPPPQPQQQAARAAPAPAQPPRAAGWQMCSTSDPADHNNDPVQAMTYIPQLAGLPSGDGHAGWLISASRGLLNLWECSPGGGRDQPSMMTMHSQMTDYLSTQLAVENPLGVMFAASTDTRQNAECVTVHSLNVESLLAFKYRFQPSKDGEAVKRTPAAARQAANKVSSLHLLGGHWRSCCAASQGGRVLIYEAPASHQNTAALPGLLKARQEWKAHDSPITALHCSISGGLLFTGAADGGILLWNLRERLPSAVRRLSLSAAVTGVQLVNEHLLAAASADGKVVLWDLRRAATPVQTVVPDGSPVLDIRTSPVGDCLAVSTTQGLHSVDLVDYSGVVSPITPAPLPRPYLAMEWNERTGELYAAGNGGVIAVYRQWHR